MENEIQQLLTMVKMLNNKIEHLEKSSLSIKPVLNVDEFCTYTGYSKSTTYKLTCQRLIPHSKPNDKSIFFSREKVDEWLLKNPIKTVSELKPDNVSRKNTFKF